MQPIKPVIAAFALAAFASAAMPAAAQDYATRTMRPRPSGGMRPARRAAGDAARAGRRSPERTGGDHVRGIHDRAARPRGMLRRTGGGRACAVRQHFQDLAGRRDADPLNRPAWVQAASMLCGRRLERRRSDGAPAFAGLAARARSQRQPSLWSRVARPRVHLMPCSIFPSDRPTATAPRHISGDRLRRTGTLGPRYSRHA